MSSQHLFRTISSETLADAKTKTQLDKAMKLRNTRLNLRSND